MSIISPMRLGTLGARLSSPPHQDLCQGSTSQRMVNQCRLNPRPSKSMSLVGVASRITHHVEYIALLRGRRGRRGRTSLCVLAYNKGYHVSTLCQHYVNTVPTALCVNTTLSLLVGVDTMPTTLLLGQVLTHLSLPSASAMYRR